MVNTKTRKYRVGLAGTASYVVDLRVDDYLFAILPGGPFHERENIPLWATLKIDQ